MSTQAVEPSAPPKGSRKKILGLPVPVVIFGGVFIAVGGYLWWRSRSSSSSGSDSSTAGASPDVSEEAVDYSGEPCTDSNGNAGMTDALGNCITTSGVGSTGTTGTGGGDGGTGTGGTGTGTGGTGTGTGTGGGGTGGGTTTKPKAPVNLAADNITSTSATLHWASMAGANSYHVTVTHAGSGETVHSQTLASNSQQVTGLKPNNPYSWKVRANNTAGTSAWSNPHAFRTAKAGS